MSDASLKVGGKARIAARPPYLKTADTMPMLRPPDLVAVGEEGTLLERKPGGYWSVKFERGAFLIDQRYLEAVD
ncbi:MAG: DUF3148 domain-containing protein [Cyanobacteria bacterium J06626_23]